MHSGVEPVDAPQNACIAQGRDFRRRSPCYQSVLLWMVSSIAAGDMGSWFIRTPTAR